MITQTIMEKSRVLVLGGCGFIGRNFINYLISNDLVDAIRCVDKVPPQVAWLNEECQKVFQDPRVEFKSCNLINPDSCKNVFRSENDWDFVVNCAGETKPGQTDPVYKEGIVQLSINCAKEAARLNVKHYVELSSGNMYSSEKVNHTEDGIVDPWTIIAKWKRQVEKFLIEETQLKWTILRPAIVYGLGDRMGLTPRIMAAAIYKHLGETMKLLWNCDLNINTIHVQDLCRAIWFVCNRDDTVHQIYNVVDESNSNQGTISKILAELFHINVDFYGNLVSLAVDLSAAANDANDKHLPPWAIACNEDGIQNTPLSPHMDAEILLHKHLRLSGSKLMNLGFKLNVPAPTVENLKAIVDDYVKMKVFPKTLAP